MKGDESQYCTIMQNGRDPGARKMNHHQHAKGQSSSKEGDVVYMVASEGSHLLRALFGKDPN